MKSIGLLFGPRRGRHEAMNFVGRTGLVFLLLVVLIAGCGSSGTDSFSSMQTSSETATATIRLQTTLAQQLIPQYVDEYRASGFDSRQNLLYGPTTVPKQNTVDFTGVPVEVTEFLIEFLDGGQVVALAQVTVQLVPGGVFVVDNPELVEVVQPRQGLLLNPSGLTLPLGTSGNLSARGLFDGEVDWSSVDPSVATVVDGTVTAVSVGTTTITANSGRETASAVVTVSNVRPVNLAVTPPEPTLALNTGVQLSVEGLFEDGTTHDLTADCSYSSTDNAVVTIGADGFMTGLAAGDATVTVSFGNLSDRVNVTVTEAVLSQIDLVLEQSSIPAGTTTRFEVIGYFDDLTHQDLTAEAVISFSPDGVSNLPAGGVLGGTAPGSTQVVARFGALQDSETLTVTAAELLSIDLRSAEPDRTTAVGVGDTLKLEVIGLFSDNSLQNLTGQVLFSVAPAGSVFVGATGPGAREVEITGGTQGPSLLTAGWIPNGSVTDSLAVAVTAPSGGGHPDLVISSDAVFNTDSGELDGTAVSGWNSEKRRLELGLFRIESGATLSLEGSSPLSVRSFDSVEIDGVLDGGSSRVDVELYALGAAPLTVNGSIPADSPGEGVDGSDVLLVSVGDLTLGELASLTSNGTDGGISVDGTDGGEITVYTLGSLTAHNDVTLSCLGGLGGDGDVLASGAGGRGGEISLRSQGDQLFGNITIVAAGNYGGYGATTSGGDGGDAGLVVVESASGQEFLGDFQIDCAGRPGGTDFLAVGTGGRGGNGGWIRVISVSTQHFVGTTSLNVVGSQGGNGGVAGEGGDGGRISVVSQGDQTATGVLAIAAQGGSGQESKHAAGGRGGNAGEVEVLSSAGQTWSGLFFVSTNGGQGGDSKSDQGGAGGAGGSVAITAALDQVFSDVFLITSLGGSGGRSDGANGGAASDAGSVLVQAGGGQTFSGSVSVFGFGGGGGLGVPAEGGAGGKGGLLQILAGTSQVFEDSLILSVRGGDGGPGAAGFPSGDGGDGGSMLLTAGATATTSTLDASGGNGGGGSGTEGAGGDGGTVTNPPPGASVDVSGGSGNPAGADGSVQ